MKLFNKEKYMKQFLRTEYPRPQFRREKWQTLNGEWEFAFDDKNEGLHAGWDEGKTAFPKKINVPFTYQYPASGIGDESDHAIVWYRRTFRAEHKGMRALLCFNGCDYVTDVWLNGKHIITHTGAYAPFSADVTDFLADEENVITVRCYDPLDRSIPRGKQSWTGERFACFYVPNTGIWQSVWLEYFGEDCVRSFHLTPDFDETAISGELTTLRSRADEAEFSVSIGGKHVKTVRFSLEGARTPYCISLKNTFACEYYWTLKQPNLFDLQVTLYVKGTPVDRAYTRYGMRKISTDGKGNILLNGKPLYQKLILDQGYWEESGATPPSAQALKEDILLAKQMGFNGARKHQKLEDPYFYYYADELGFLTWCEMPSGYCYNEDEVAAVSREWQEIVSVARNFTSVVCYVPLNESWGVGDIVTDKKQQDFARAMYYLTRSLGQSRLVSTNDGWENLSETDIVSIHDYAFDSAQFAEKYQKEKLSEIYPQGRRLFAFGSQYCGQPYLMTEFGGIAMQSAQKGDAWGYNSGAKDEAEFLARYEDLINGIYACGFQGFCYTQLTDVQQEVNGLLYVDRSPKFDMKRLKRILDSKYCD